MHIQYEMILGTPFAQGTETTQAADVVPTSAGT
jgi:hypothetical protein